MREPTVPRWEPDFPSLWTFLQLDPRFVLVFWREDPGEGVVPPWFHYFAVVWIVLAGFVWGGAASLAGAEMPRAAVPFWSFAALVFLKSRPLARENARRKREHSEIRPMMSVGLPRVLNWRRFMAWTRKEQLRRLRWATQRVEPAVGLLCALVCGIASPAFGVYLAALVLLLWAENAGILYRERAERIALQDAMAVQVVQQRVLEEIDAGRQPIEAFDLREP